MPTFVDKPQFNLKQMISAITIAIVIGGSIARYEYRSNTMEAKLDKVISFVDTVQKNNNNRYFEINQRLLANQQDIKSVTTSLTVITAFLKPEEIRFKRR